MKNIYIIGIGLIGGSMALDIKKLYPDSKVYGIDVNEEHLDQALDLKLIDKKGQIGGIGKCRRSCAIYSS